MTVYISPNPGKSSARELALRAAQILRAHGASVLMEHKWQQSCNIAGVEYLPFETCMEQTDVILTIGGDGTILHVANQTLSYHKPILGINLGRCGFLATCEVDELETKLSAVARGQYSLDSRMLLYVRVLGDDRWEGHALNDVVVTKGRLQQAIDFSVYCDDILVEHFRGDGVIVATPTGSTSWIPRPRASWSRPSAPTAWRPRPWSLPRSARSTSAWGRWPTTRCSSAATATRAAACGPARRRWSACRTRMSSSSPSAGPTSSRPSTRS